MKEKEKNGGKEVTSICGKSCKQYLYDKQMLRCLNTVVDYITNDWPSFRVDIHVVVLMMMNIKFSCQIVDCLPQQRSVWCDQQMNNVLVTMQSNWKRPNGRHWKRQNNLNGSCRPIDEWLIWRWLLPLDNEQSGKYEYTHTHTSLDTITPTPTT